MKRRITFLHLFLMNQLILTLVVLGLIGAYGTYLVNQEQGVLKERIDPLLARESERISNELQVLEVNVLRIKNVVETFGYIPRDRIESRFQSYASSMLGPHATQYNAWFALGPQLSKSYFGKEGYVATVHRDAKNDNRFVFEKFTIPGYDTDSSIEWWKMNRVENEVKHTDFHSDHGFLEKVMFTTATGIFEGNKLIAVAGIDTLADQIADRLAQFKLGTTGGAVIVDEYGRPILPLLSRSLPLAGFKFQATSPDKFDRMPKLSEKAFALSSQKLQDFKGDDGETYLTLSRAIKGRPWNLVVFQSKEEAYSGLYRRLFVLMLVVMVAYLIASLALYFTGQMVLTRQRGDYEELRNSRDQARAATEAKSAFLSTMSHEIRTPLNSMLGSAELLAETTLDSDQNEYLQTLRGAGDSLLSILNNILDFSKIEAGKMSLDVKEFRLSDLIHEVQMLMGPAISRRNLEFNVVTPEIDRFVTGDYIRIKQVILNLLGNAAKFTEKGKIELRVSARGIPESEQVRYHFEVSDTGVGIAKENLHRIFDEFSQEDSSVTRRFGGTGLGLSISQKLIKMMNGEIGCQSQQYVGSTFYFYIDLLSGSAGPWRARSIEAPAPALLRTSLQEQIQKFDVEKKILLVDDMEDNHQLMRAYIKKLGNVFVESAYSGAECIEKFAKGPYDLIFMDVQMPRISGLETIQRLREIENHRSQQRTPIIVVSANNFTEDREKSLAAGADEHCGKPIRKQVIVDLIVRYCLKENAPVVVN
ncbi:MAG: response regulator [Bdellovibrio sp.]|nr:response regulator [Bdellovibrio sp.]